FGAGAGGIRPRHIPRQQDPYGVLAPIRSARGATGRNRCSSFTRAILSNPSNNLCRNPPLSPVFPCQTSTWSRARSHADRLSSMPAVIRSGRWYKMSAIWRGVRLRAVMVVPFICKGVPLYHSYENVNSYYPIPLTAFHGALQL